MESQPQNPEFRNNPENFHPWSRYVKGIFLSINCNYLPTYQFHHVFWVLKRVSLNPQHIIWLRNKKNDFPLKGLIRLPTPLFPKRSYDKQNLTLVLISY